MTSDQTAVAHAKIGLTRAKAEIRLLACVASIGYSGFEMAEKCGIKVGDFSQPDALIIYHAIGYVGTLGGKGSIALYARERLKLQGLWSESDLRPRFGGGQWGPEELGRLFFGISAETAKKILPACAAELLAIIAAQRSDEAELFREDVGDLMREADRIFEA